MALVVKDRVKVSSTTTGTGTFTLGAAATGFQNFSVIGDGNTTYYTIAGVGTSEFEVGIGTFTASGTTLSRDTILESSNAGSAVNFSAGIKDVFVTYPAERAVYTDAAGTAITPATASTLGVLSGGTGQTTYTNGELLIGNTTGNTLTKATLTGGTGISVTNGTGSITVAATNNGTVTSVSGTGTVQGLSLSGTVTSSGNLTLGGSLSAVSLTTQVSGTLPVANGGTGITSFGAGVATFLGTPTSANLKTAVTDETGSGALVFATSPTLVTPVLGTPTSGTLSGCTVDGTDAVGFRNTPINSRSAAYTLVLADSGKTILHPIADDNARTFTIPANSSVAYPVGTVVTFINLINTVTIAITTDTMYLAGDGATGSRTLAAYGVASAVKVASTTWVISGNGLT
jgi:hypothetical protein